MNKDEVVREVKFRFHENIMFDYDISQKSQKWIEQMAEWAAGYAYEAAIYNMKNKMETNE